MGNGLTLRRRLALEAFRTVRDDLVRKHQIRKLFWECTLRCNLHCRHCGSDCKNIARIPDMPKEDFFRVLDNVARECDPHQVMLVITGGEPLLRKDLAECGKVFHEKGFPWGMVSNGFALTEEKFRELRTAHLAALTISLDGLGEDHDWMRGVPGSFDRAARAIKMAAADSSLSFDVVTCVNGRNLPHLSELREWLISAGVGAWRLFTVFPVGRAAEEPLMCLSGSELRSLMEFIKETRRDGRIRASFACEGFLGNYEGEVRNLFYMCRAGISVGSVLADGSISACPSIRADYHQGNIYRDDFMDVWENGFKPYRDREWMRKDMCGDCKYFRYCLGNGMHLRDSEGKLIQCNLKRLESE